MINKANQLFDMCQNLYEEIKFNYPSSLKVHIHM